MQWSRLKKEVESRFAPALRGRVEVFAAVYRKPATTDGRAWITLDGEQVWSMADMPTRADREAWARDHADVTYEELVADPLRYANLPGTYFTHREMRSAMECALQSGVEEMLQSPLALERALAMLDGRLGKRRFLRLGDMAEEHPLVRLLHRIRAEAEGWPLTPAPGRGEASGRSTPPGPGTRSDTT